MLKHGRIVLCSVHWEGKSTTVVVCYDRRACGAFLSSYVRLKLVLRYVDFWVPCKIGRNYVEKAPHDAVLREAGRGDHDGRSVL